MAVAEALVGLAQVVAVGSGWVVQMGTASVGLDTAMQTEVVVGEVAATSDTAVALPVGATAARKPSQLAPRNGTAPNPRHATSNSKTRLCWTTPTRMNLSTAAQHRPVPRETPCSPGQVDVQRT